MGPMIGAITKVTDDWAIPWVEFKVDIIIFPGGLRGEVPPRGVRGAVRASHLAKKSKGKTPRVFVHAAFDVDTPRP